MYPVLSEMMSDLNPVRPRTIKVGIVGTMRRVFQEEYGKKRFAEFLVEIYEDERVEFVTPQAVGVPDGIIYAGQLNQTQNSINYFLADELDGLIIIPVNYGDEESAAKIASAVYRAWRVPVYTYIWPDAPICLDGRRLSDNECGILPMRQHMRVSMGKNPGYFPFCDIGSAEFNVAWDDFVRICSGVRTARNVRLLQIGAAVPTFYAIEANPDDLRKRFNFRYEAMELWTLIEAIKKGMDRAPKWLSALHNELRATLDFSGVDERFPDLSLRMALTLGWIVEQLKEKQSNCVSFRCWDELMKATEMMVCPLNGILYSMGVMAPCETDKPGVIASALLHGLGIGDKEDLNFFADFTRWDNGRPLWWHCGPFPACGMRAGCPARVEEGWILPVKSAGLVSGPWGRICDQVTLVQIRPNEQGKLQLVALNGEICDGHYTIGTYFYTKASNPEFCWDRIMENPFDHHFSGRVGNYMRLLKEAARWLDLETEPALIYN